MFRLWQIFSILPKNQYITLYCNGSFLYTGAVWAVEPKYLTYYVTDLFNDLHPHFYIKEDLNYEDDING